jgi:hypothetical protein
MGHHRSEVRGVFQVFQALDLTLDCLVVGIVEQFTRGQVAQLGEWPLVETVDV